MENFRERMQLRRSLIELEDQNVQNSIEVGRADYAVCCRRETGWRDAEIERRCYHPTEYESRLLIAPC